MLAQGATCYGAAKALADQRRGQYQALQEAAEQQGLRFGLDPTCQDAQGWFGWMIPSLRQTIQAHAPAGLDLDAIFPVPEWAATALTQAVPRGTDWQPVAPEVTSYLQGLAPVPPRPKS